MLVYFCNELDWFFPSNDAVIFILSFSYVFCVYYSLNHLCSVCGSFNHATSKWTQRSSNLWRRYDEFSDNSLSYISWSTSYLVIATFAQSCSYHYTNHTKCSVWSFEFLSTMHSPTLVFATILGSDYMLSWLVWPRGTLSFIGKSNYFINFINFCDDKFLNLFLPFLFRTAPRVHNYIQFVVSNLHNINLEACQRGQRGYFQLFVSLSAFFSTIISSPFIVFLYVGLSLLVVSIYIYLGWRRGFSSIFTDYPPFILLVNFLYYISVCCTVLCIIIFIYINWGDLYNSSNIFNNWWEHICQQ